MHFIFCTHTLGIHHNLESLTKLTKSNPSQTISRPQQQHRYEQPDLHPEHLLHGKVGIFLGPQGKPNLCLHPAMESQSELATTLTATWARSCSTSGALRGRERSSRRGSLLMLRTRWTWSSCDVKLSSICYRIIATGASTSTPSWPRAESRGAAGERLGGRTGGLALNKFLSFVIVITTS